MNKFLMKLMALITYIVIIIGFYSTFALVHYVSNIIIGLVVLVIITISAHYTLDK